MEREDFSYLPLRTLGIALFRGALDSPAARDFVLLLELLSEENPKPAAVADTFGRLWEELAVDSGDLLPDAWQSYLVGRILDDENPFSLAAERGALGTSVVEQARRDLRTLQELFEIEAEPLLDMVERAVPGLKVWVPWTDPGLETENSHRGALARKLADTDDWGAGAELLVDFYARHGAGALNRRRAFRWRAGGLHPVKEPDPARLTQLVGHENERKPLLENTERFLAGRPAHHALLYGLPGTGKSSTVKAILNEYADKGLRLVEVAKEDLGELPLVLEALRGRGPRFVLFVDDLSFEEHEVEYKALKALLEGSAEEPPQNVRIYATSNRRNIIRESFSDRQENGFSPANDDVHARDTMHEKLSLAARFGLRVTLPPPDQTQYLEIVRALVRKRGIEIPEETLAERALLWDRWHAGRSGRTARQFVDELEAETVDGGRLPDANSR